MSLRSSLLYQVASLFSHVSIEGLEISIIEEVGVGLLILSKQWLHEHRHKIRALM
ncbi:MAG: hypothetical protein R2685_04950 [Candidatus Nitrosocosmicus sp.]|nr:hypothetical protein [Candidatus Nitrosocosmicus sp.]